MQIEITEAEAREVCLVLRYLYDASLETPYCTQEALQVYISVATKLQDALRISDTPWNQPELYEPQDRSGLA